MKTILALITILSLGFILDSKFDQAIEICQSKGYTLNYCTDKLK